MSIQKLIAILFVISLTGCATSSDPSQGGLFGYLAHHDEYDARIQQRRQQLSQQQNVNENLMAESKTLVDHAREKEYELTVERKRLAGMESDINRLDKAVSRLRAKSAKQKADISALREKINVQRKGLKAHDAALKELERSGGRTADPEKYLLLEQERDRLAKEYELLLKYSQALANAAK